MTASSSKAARANRVGHKARTSVAGKSLATGTPNKVVVTVTGLSSRASMVADAVGGQTQLASILAVNKSQPSNWIKGTERPNPSNARTLVDLDHVIARIQLLWAPSMVTPWLKASNAFLDGARPIDVLRVEGTSRVLEALDAEASGVFA